MEEYPLFPKQHHDDDNDNDNAPVPAPANNNVNFFVNLIQY